MSLSLAPTMSLNNPCVQEHWHGQAKRGAGEEGVGLCVMVSPASTSRAQGTLLFLLILTCRLRNLGVGEA